MKTTALRAVLAAALIALAALLLITAPARADQPPPPEQPAAPLPPASEAAPPPAMDQPAQTGVEEPQPLAALEVQPYLGGDPWFKVGSVIHRYMTDCTGQPLPCTQSATPISAALNAIAIYVNSL